MDNQPIIVVGEDAVIVELHVNGMPDTVIQEIKNEAHRWASDARAVLYHFNCEGGRKAGSFTESLIHTIALADKKNTALLSQSFPHLVSWIFAVQYIETGKDYVRDIAEKFETVQ